MVSCVECVSCSAMVIIQCVGYCFCSSQWGSSDTGSLKLRMSLCQMSTIGCIGRVAAYGCRNLSEEIWSMHNLQKGVKTMNTDMAEMLKRLFLTRSRGRVSSVSFVGVG